MDWSLVFKLLQLLLFGNFHGSFNYCNYLCGFNLWFVRSFARLIFFLLLFS